jgi:hypothetical protein
MPLTDAPAPADKTVSPKNEMIGEAFSVPVLAI